MDMAPASVSSNPRSVEEIYKDFSGRRAGLVRALTSDVDDFYSSCDPDKENLCLYGLPNGTWAVAPPAEEVPPEMPEPALGINFARDGMQRRDWLSLVAVHSDSWLISVAFFFGARLNANDRKRLFSMVSDLPSVFEAFSDRKHGRDRSGIDSSGKSRHSSKRGSDGHVKNSRATAPAAKQYDDDDDEDDEEHTETFCGTCGGLYNSNEFWIGCDICERWFHGKCVRITPARADHIKHYKCPDCSSKKMRQ
ncbi:ALFIN-like transcription factor [Panicum miliaceum]|uniref:PHD finger protein ALFIN-LIKE n=1 Tax=Panicum miliaceum TaxID=4540 RepID=A0A3L6SEZ7_PANMI|nr:ALFIN-like transcription factor [Panicum miliaceum]